ncbi:SpvB/TcaC N-terminal domain-containing protein [Terracidiphilus gabretensis]|uniref:SpvB/TcaC N-terminal domain-containing protein n=1 Tax=Terracidiphilus gabretensis TaxID=1577687 RepID=UPI00071C1075|nr:SpvB/TcaC N-terminal domain-containing protein [Terracidiphilus gabretensis]
MGEKFSANPVTGTGSLNIPIYTSPGRSGFQPQLSLSYDSGSGNGPFGFGWTLALPAVARKTEKGLPQYEDAGESDIFILSGAEDLIPSLEEVGGQWVRDIAPTRTLYGSQYSIHSYRPRVEGLFARIERWVNLTDSQDTFWRSISRDNVTTWYGKTPESRIADPANPAHVFKWLACMTYDDKGHAMVFEYKSEDSSAIDFTQVNERNRTDMGRSANRYLKHVFYGNLTSYFPDLTAAAEVPLPTDWCFELVFDYGEHDLLNPVPQETGTLWTLRPDPFSTYRSTFEIRTYRLCRRTLMFHHFPAETNVGPNCLVRSTDLSYALPQNLQDASQPFYSYLLSATLTSYSRNGADGYFSKSLPLLELKYTQATVDETVREIDPRSRENTPYGIENIQYRWVDLNGEGSAGILTEQAGSWFYKPNLSPANLQTINGEACTLPQFGPLELVARQPAAANLNGGRQQLLNLSGDGQLDLVDFQAPMPGYFERTENADWTPFVSFQSLPVLDWHNPELKFVDLTRDGFADLLVNEGDGFWWYKSLATLGFATGQRSPQALDEEKGPRILFSDGTESIFLADISGDGLTDIVRVRNGDVCYWPNLGYGNFGPKVIMDHAPLFDRPDLFDGQRIHLADIDGSGTVDILYFAGGSVQLYFNQSGNGWGTARILGHFPTVDSLSSAAVFDLLGNGTACLVWSSPLAGNAQRPMRYIDLMGGQKPHLLVQITNNLGAETMIQYAPSTKFYVEDKLAGTPWVTRLPFPVHVVELVQTYDCVGRNLLVTRYAYHHGFFDGVEREFRGFGRVDQWDTQEFSALANSADFPESNNLDTAFNVPSVLTKTWFHTGAYFQSAKISSCFEKEYYAEGDVSGAIAGLPDSQLQAMLLDDTVLPSTILLPDGTHRPYTLSPEELREACRALRGSILRQEVYALDDTEMADRPYTASERNYMIEVVQPRGPNQFGTFFAHPREAIDFQYERILYSVVDNTITTQIPPPSNAIVAADPRVTHAMTLKVDPFGNVLQSVTVAYGRRFSDPSTALTAEDRSKQSILLATYLDNSYTNAIIADDSYRVPLPAEANTYQLLQVQPENTHQGLTSIFGFTKMQGLIQAASDGNHDIAYEDLNPMGLNPGEPYRRILGQARILYRPDDLGASAGSPQALLPLAKLESMAISGCSYELAFTESLIAQVYERGGTPLLPTPVTVLGEIGADGGGYVDMDGNGDWWTQSGRVYYSVAPGIPDELQEARNSGFLPRRFDDPFGNAATVAYDNYGLLPIQTADAIGNTTIAVNDYRVLQPLLLTDANGNCVAASFDILGMVAGTAVMSKASNSPVLGDSLNNFIPDLTDDQVNDFFAADDPHSIANDLLGTATTRILYDLNRFQNSQAAAPTDPTQWQPIFAATLARETHVSDLATDEATKIQITFSYSDGLGREIQNKVQAEPGPVVDQGPVVDPRWVGNGWVIFNNKGKPVRQYEPFFSQLAKGHQFEFGVQVGVSSTLFYDPVERVVATLHPNQTYEKVVFDPWHSQSWDVNDTILQANPAEDADIGDFFQTLPESDYLPTWYALRTDPAYASQSAQLWPDPVILAKEVEAAGKAAAHAGTPSIAYFDVLRRSFLTIADNGGEQKYATRVKLDVQDLQRSVTDALGRKVMEYDYDMLGNRIHQSSMEAGERWTLNDVTGKLIHAWDTRGHNFRTTYDTLRRPLGSFVLGIDAVNSDARTTAAEVQIQKTVYGEGLSPALNLNTRVYQVYDTAGVVTSAAINPTTGEQEAYDFKGNMLRCSRQFVDDYRALPDWSSTTAPVLVEKVFASGTQYDALNRPLAGTTPDGSVVRATYNEANLLETVSVNLQGAASSTPFVTNIDYDAKGQRTLINYGNGAATSYAYDQTTFHLTRLTTTRPTFPINQQVVQDLQYVYDPAGNITHIQDDADIQNAVFFSNQRVAPSSDYTYDAIYRLIQASGREQLGLDNNGKQLAATPGSYNDIPRAGLLNPSDGNAMGTYTEQYNYDPVGNFLQFIHKSSSASSPGWTRSYSYNEASLLEPANMSNRLSTTGFGEQPPSETYGYDLHGNMIDMPQLQLMQWDFKDALYMSQRQAVNSTDADGIAHQGERTYYVYEGSGQRIRKVTESAAQLKKNERFYLGGFEVYREYSLSAVTLERETLHVMDDKQRIALVETRTQGTDGLAEQLVRYQFGNHLGSASLELDDYANVITYEEYCPYGNTSYQAGRSAVEVALKRYRYTGMERDEETGLNYHGVRYYASWLGRWTSSDPIGIGDGVDMYAYARNCPVLLTDLGGTDSRKLPPISPGEFESDVEVVHRYGVHSRYADRESIRTLIDLGFAQNTKDHSIFSHDNNTPAKANLADIFDIGAAAYATRYNLNQRFLFAALRGNQAFENANDSHIYQDDDGKNRTGKDSRENKVIRENDRLFAIPVALDLPGLLGEGTAGGGGGGGDTGPVEFAWGAPLEPPPAEGGGAREGNNAAGQIREEYSGTPLGKNTEYVEDLSHVSGQTAFVRNALIRHVLANDLPGFELPFIPKYNPFLKPLGVAKEGLGSQLGKLAFASRRQIADTIVHETLHHFWWSRGLTDHHNVATDALFHEEVGQILDHYGIPRSSYR